jgi:hypothetical protein
MASTIELLMSMEQLVERKLAGEKEVLGENLPQCLLSTTNSTWPDYGSDPGRLDWKPATNYFSRRANNNHRKRKSCVRICH